MLLLSGIKRTLLLYRKINEKFEIKKPAVPRSGSGSLISLNDDFLRRGARRLRAWRIGVGAGRGGRCPHRIAEAMPLRRCGKRIIKIIQSQTRERLTHDPFESPDHIVIFGRDECKRVTCSCPRPVRPNSMDVGIGGIGHIVVDDMRDVFYIDAAAPQYPWRP